MKIQTKIKRILKNHYGEFNTRLELEYENKMVSNLSLGDTDLRVAWLTYNQLILEIKHSLKDEVMVSELLYMLTSDLNPNEVCLTIIEKIGFDNSEIERLYYKIKGFEI